MGGEEGGGRREGEGEGEGEGEVRLLLLGQSMHRKLSTYYLWAESLYPREPGMIRCLQTVFPSLFVIVLTVSSVPAYGKCSDQQQSGGLELQYYSSHSSTPRGSLAARAYRLVPRFSKNCTKMK